MSFILLKSKIIDINKIKREKKKRNGGGGGRSERIHRR